MRRKDATTLGDFSAFNNWIKIPYRFLDSELEKNNELNMDNNSWRAKKTKDLRKGGEMLAGPALPLYSSSF